MANPAFAVVSFKTSKRDYRLIERIVDRAFDPHVGLAGLPGTRLDLEMDLSATHANGCPLDFAKLLAFDTFNFAHDLYGIRRCIDRKTGALTRHFRPRCAKPARRSALSPQED